MANQSSIFPIYLRAEYREDGAGFARFQSDAQRAAQAAKREFEGVRTALDQALSRPRNTGGSLDLGVDEMRQAAMAQQQIAAAAREVANATKAAATANGAFDAAMSRSTRAAFELANAEERVSREMMEQVVALEAVQRELNQTASATDLVTEANRRGTTATSNVINSQRASRTAFIQLGQQLQDVAVQAQMGTSAFLIFGQQAPQAAFALTGLADSANKTQRAIGNFATFMSGPFGAAIFVAVAALGPFVAKLFESGNEADKAKVKTFNFAAGLDILSLSADNATAAMEQLIGKMRSAIQLQGDFLRGEIAIARQSAEKLQAQIKADQSELAKLTSDRGGIGETMFPTFFGPSAQERKRINDLQTRIAKNREALPQALEAAGVAAIAEANRNIAESMDPILRQLNAVDQEIAQLNQRRLDTVQRNDILGDNNLSQADFERQLGELARRRAALEKQQRDTGGGSRSNRSTAAEQRRTVRETEQLANFGAQAAEQIQRINERFDEQPRLIDQAAQATRQLDEIIADLEQRKPLNFEELVKGAQAAKKTVEEALLRPIEMIRQESEARLAIEEALAAGQIDRAAALQEIFRLEQQIGVLSDEQREDVEDIVIAEQRRLRVLRDQQQVFNAQLDVLGTVRRDLTDILSGRSTDFFGNFRQALQDLQGQRLFETIFGDTFRQIENELQANSPQGKANEAYRVQVEKTADTTVALEESLFSLASTASGVSARMAAIASGRAADAANDNGSIVGGITVTATRRPQTDITTRSTIDLATRISRGIGESIGAQLEEVLGPRFAAMLGDIVGGAIAGKVIGGTAGSIIGGLQGLTSSIKGLEGVSAGLGAVLKGIGAGTQVNALGNALGVKGSKAGSQIGGVAGQALGTLIGGPVGGKIGALIGALGGNLLGGLLKSTPRASATIGGVGSALGLSSVTGTSGSLRDAAGGLGNSVLETVNRIAQQLGASINASAGSVSIGQRKDNLRVDTTGRGITKIGNGAIDFGDDAEAAVAFAVRDLIQDGVITGLRQSEQNLLRASKDIETALSDVMRFRGVFDQLREIKDPLGFAIEQLNREFDGLIDLFERAGASAEELGSLEELYNLRRAEAIRDATDRVVGSLRQLLNELTIGDSGLSLRSRRANAASQFDALAARVAAGDSTAFDDFADISQQLLDIERQLFGSTQSYFDRLAQVTALTERAIQDQTNVTSIAAGSASPFGNQVEIDRSIDTMNANLGNKLDAIINNQILAISSAGPAAPAGSGIVRGDFTSFPIRIANF